MQMRFQEKEPFRWKERCP